MNFDNPIVIIAGLTGFIYLLTGWYMLKRPAKKINYFYGYRTKRSMESQETWDFAQVYSAKELIKSGLVTCLVGVSGLFFQMNQILAVFFGMTIVILAIVVVFFRVENALKGKFPS